MTKIRNVFILFTPWNCLTFWLEYRKPLGLWLIPKSSFCGQVDSTFGGGGGFFPRPCRDLGWSFDDSFPSCDFFFFKVEIISPSPIPLFRPGSVHSGSVGWDDCGLVFPATCVWSSLPCLKTAREHRHRAPSLPVKKNHYEIYTFKNELIKFK